MKRTLIRFQKAASLRSCGGSLLLTLYGFLGSGMGRVCKLIERKDTSLSFDTFSDVRKDNELERVKEYVRDVLEAVPFFTTAAWRDLQTVRRVRNCMVHNDGTVRGRDADRRAIEGSAFFNDGVLIRGDEIVLTSGVWKLGLASANTLLEDFRGSLLKWAAQHSENIKPLPEEYPEYYLGPVANVHYVPEPPTPPAT